MIIIGDGPERIRLKKLAEKIYPSTIFPGALFNSDLDSYYTEADLFVLPGTGGLAIQQAMRFGLPIIVSEGDGTQYDLVRDGNGWHFETGDVDALSKIINQALSSPSQLRRMGEESYRIVDEEINIDAMVRTFMQALSLTKSRENL